MLQRRAALALTVVLSTPLALAAEQRLTAVRNAYPHPSPDGARVLFQSDRSGRWELYTMNADGSGVVRLTDRPGENVTAKWSPDGTRIVFASEPEPGNSEIFVMNADGSEVRRLTDSAGDDSHPAWSPDGRIFFNSPRATPDPSAPWGRQWHDIYSMNADGGDLRRHTHCETVCTYPAPSPDGRRLAYRKIVATPGFNWDLSSAERNSEVVVADIASGEEVNLTRSAAFDGWPAWSPDGRSVLFASNRGGPANVGQIWRVASDGSGAAEALTAGPWAHVQPAMRADGALLSYLHLETPEPETGDVALQEVP